MTTLHDEQFQFRQISQKLVVLGDGMEKSNVVLSGKALNSPAKPPLLSMPMRKLRLKRDLSK